MADKNYILRFEFIPASAVRDRADGYGAGALFLNGAPFWFSETADSPGLVEWTWVDFLEHLSFVWAALIVEQNYPFDWLSKTASHPGEMWEKAELRWSFKGDAVADEEEPILYAFHNRHNLASGWKGIGMPGLYWLRSGNSVWLSPEGGSPIRADFAECMRSLEEVGCQMAECFRESDNPRVTAAVDAWHARNRKLESTFFKFSSGLDMRTLSLVECGRPQSEFWGVHAASDWQAAAANDNEFLAAARMTSGILEPKAIAALIEIIRSVPKEHTPDLDALGQQAVRYLESCDYRYAHESGYRLAEWLRERLGVALNEAFDIETKLKKLKILTVEAKFGSDHIEAMACLGQRGPCIIVNDDRAYADNNQRLRMTLAHELCHFLVDRHTALPVAEVLGGSVDLYVEKRANAFAAELLLPRAAVALAWQKGEVKLGDALRSLENWFGVSKTVACAQVLNSPEYAALTGREREYVQRRVSKSTEIKFLDANVISTII